MKSETVIVMAPNAYVSKGYELSGYKTLTPYRGSSFFWRAAREIWIKMHLPQKIWYSRKVLKSGAENIIVKDAKITTKYLEWLKGKCPDAEIFYMYSNMVGKASNLKPEEVPEGISIWTYDDYDARTYGINLKKSGYFAGYKKGAYPEKDFDVFFVGADKGRAEYLLELEKQFAEMGLKTKFVITKWKFFDPPKPYYSKRISYEEVIENSCRSKAILNVVMQNQEGATMRDFESAFNGVKLITTNEHALKFDFLREENVFILGKRDLSELPDFLNTPFVPVEEEILARHSAELVIEEMIADVRQNNIKTHV